MRTKGRPWNWLLVSFDQWRGDWWHQSWLQTRHLRRLVRHSTILDRAYTSSPQCVPARASWLTGLSPQALGVTSNQPFTMPADAPSFVRSLRDAGWHTELVGKTHWTPHEAGVDLRHNQQLLQGLGFERSLEIAGPRALAVLRCPLTEIWQRAGLLEAYQADLKRRYHGGTAHRVWPTVLPTHLYPDVWLADRALERLQQQPSDQPWFLWVSFVGPHEPFDVPTPWRGRHCSTDIPAPYPRPSHALEVAPPGTALHRLLERWPNGLPAGVVRRLRADYADHLSLLDDQLGRLLAGLNNRLDSDNTAIAVISDHGELLGDWGLLLKGCFLEGAIRSLCLFQAPQQRISILERSPQALTPALQSMAQAVQKGSSAPWHEQRRRQRRQDVDVQFSGETLRIRQSSYTHFDQSGSTTASSRNGLDWKVLA